MRTLTLLILLSIGVVYLGGCHWHHRHHRHSYAEGYYQR